MGNGPTRGGKQKKVLAKTKRAHKDKKGKGRKRQKACKGYFLLKNATTAPLE